MDWWLRSYYIFIFLILLAKFRVESTKCFQNELQNIHWLMKDAIIYSKLVLGKYQLVPRTFRYLVFYFNKKTMSKNDFYS